MKALRALVVPFCAALLGALSAHNAIDFFGDFLLPHDTYDGIAHGSRLLFFGVTIAFVALVLGIACRAAVREARGRDAAFCEALRALSPRGARTFLAIVSVLTFVCVVAMQGLDCAAAGVDVDGIADLFGGSLLLGAACTLGSAFAAAACTWCAFERLVRIRRSIVAVAIAFVRRGRGTAPVSRVRRAPVRVLATIAGRAGRPCAGRAPPLRTMVR